jgi:hypothetical protein
LVWQQRNICNLSGVKGDWKINSLTKLAFDEIVIVPKNPADDKVKGGDYTLQNIQIVIVLVAINEMKWNYPTRRQLNI